LDFLKKRWDEDFESVVPETVWQLSEHPFVSDMGYSNLRIHRLHFPRSKLARIFPEIDTMCSTCHRGEANLGYMFWTCPALGPFWSAVFETFSYICVKEIELDPIVAVFGVASENLHQVNQMHWLSLLCWPDG